MAAGLLPLFPLPLVLFPGTQAPLHIFEERYKEMIGEAIVNRTEFGIVLAGEKGIVNAGCTAVVERVVERYPDGKLDIVARGRRRFELLSLNEERDYLRGEVEFFDDDDDEAVPAQLREQVIDLYAEITALAPGGAVAGVPAPGERRISFHIAGALPDMMARQLLLMSRSEADRMRELASQLQSVLELRTQQAKAIKSASTNGHGPRPAGL